MKTKMIPQRIRTGPVFVLCVSHFSEETGNIFNQVLDIRQCKLTVNPAYRRAAADTGADPSSS
jgi:hypothetical protein